MKPTTVRATAGLLRRRSNDGQTFQSRIYFAPSTDGDSPGYPTICAFCDFAQKKVELRGGALNLNDQIRKQILQYFYERNSNATSRLGKRGSAVKISDAKRELKARFGLSQSQVVSNLTYLIDQNWVKTFEVEKTVTVRGGTVPSKVMWFEIAAPGIDKFEETSDFKQEERYSGININATGRNIITLGDGNVVNAKYEQLHRNLSELKQAISGSDRITEDKKLDLSADVESIKDQLAKTVPDKTVVRRLWSGLEKAATVAGLIEAAEKVRPLIESVF